MDTKPALRDRRAVANLKLPISGRPSSPARLPGCESRECAAQQGRFAAYHDMLFDRFDSLSATSFDDVAARLHISGTPTVIVNRMMYAFAPPLAVLKKMVQRAR